jgi:hypothetical protein
MVAYDTKCDDIFHPRRFELCSQVWVRVKYIVVHLLNQLLGAVG